MPTKKKAKDNLTTVLQGKALKMFGIIAALVVVGGVVGAVAYNSTAQHVVETNNGTIYMGTQVTSPETAELGSEVILGGEATTTAATITRFNDLLARGCRIVTDDTQQLGQDRSNSYWECYETIDFADATNTVFAFQNRKGQVLWVDNRSAVQFEDIATSTTKVVTGTSTTQYINVTATDTIEAVAGNSVGLNSILQTGSVAAGTATSTALYEKSDFQGVDTRDGTGTRNLVPVLPGEYITGVATSTEPGAVTESANLLDGVFHLWYRIYNP